MKFIVDDKIPFIEGRLEPFGEVKYVAPGKITSDVVKDADALIVRTRTRCDKTLLKDSGVSLVATATIGTDHIDSEWCEANGITVRNAAGCNAPGVAQYVWSSLLRKGFDPGRHTLGVIGHGHVGSIVTDWGERLGARVLVCDPPRKDAGYTDRLYLPIETLLKECDAVTLHTPLTAEGEYPTHHLIDACMLGMMKKGSILINSSRGPVVDNEAWARHLGETGATGIIDVWEGEPDISRLLLDAASIATPHIAGYSYEGKQRATRMALEAVNRHFGISASTEGLCGQYNAPEKEFTDITAQIIKSSYDPEADTAALRRSPADFERLRSDYIYRHEPSF